MFMSRLRCLLVCLVIAMASILTNVAEARDVGDRGADRAQDRVDNRGDRIDGDRIDIHRSDKV